MIAVLLSERAHRTVLSTSVIFLVAGFLIGRGAVGWVSLGPEDKVIRDFAELVLFMILFVAGAELPVKELTRAWHSSTDFAVARVFREEENDSAARACLAGTDQRPESPDV